MWGRFLTLALVAGSVAMVGCTPRVRVRRSPGPSDTGIRYYRPKPYLRVEPGQVTTTSGKVTTAVTSDQHVTIALEYLPDFSEEYSIDVCTGLGRANVGIHLEDGWNLTQVNQELDSNFDDNVRAIADLAESIEGFIPSATTSSESSDRKWVVRSTNVPIGYYESVISRDSCGRKRLDGWRYIGFLPFAACPTQMCGGDHLSCHAIPSQLYGIVFREGVMTFCPIDMIAQSENAERVSVATGEDRSLPHHALGQLNQSVRRALLETEGADSAVDSRITDEGRTVEIVIKLQHPIHSGTDGEGVGPDIVERATIAPALVRDLLDHLLVEQSLNALGNPVPRFLYGDPVFTGGAADGVRLEDVIRTES